MPPQSQPGMVGAGGTLQIFKFFIPPTYRNVPFAWLDDTTTSEYPGFNFMATQGFLSNAIAESNMGDTPELPPPVGSAGDVILMGWSGYRVDPSVINSQNVDKEQLPPIFAIGQTTLMGYKGYYVLQRILAMSQDYDVERLPSAVVTIFNDLTNDEENQKLQPGYLLDGLIEPNLGDNVELPPTLSSWTDTILMGYRGYSIPKSLMLLADEGVEKITLPFNDWTGDGENQKLQFPYNFDGLPEPNLGDNLELPPPITGVVSIEMAGWAGYWTLDKDGTDHDIERQVVVVTVFNDWTNDGENQLQQLGYGFDRVLEPNLGDNPELPPSLLSWTDTILMAYDGYRTSPSLMLQADDGEELILVARAFDTDADQQRDNSWRFGQDDVLDSGVELVQPFRAWDTDSDQQLSNMFWFGRDDVSDAGVELVQPYMAWDTDADSQRLQLDYTPDRELSDTGVERIQIALTTGWDNDGENQKLWADWVKDHLSDEGVELIQLAPLVTALYFWDTDAENQKDNSWWIKDDVMDSGVERIQIALTTGWDTDADNQIPNLPWYLDQVEFQDRELLVEPFMAWDDDQELQQLGYQGLGSDQGQDTTNYIILPFEDWTTDSENQKLQPLMFGQDTVQDEGVERIVLPFNDWTTDAENQRDVTWRFTTDTLMDEGVERIQIALTTGWDTDAENQLLQPLWNTDRDLSDTGVELVQPWEAWDHDADYQWNTGRWFGTDDVSDSGVELITRPADDWTTDAENQLLQLGYQGVGSDQGEDWQHVIIVPPIVLKLTAYDTDADQQMDRSWRIGDDVLDSGVEQIFLPYNPWDWEQEFPGLGGTKPYLEDEVLVQTVLYVVSDGLEDMENWNWTPQRMDFDDREMIVLPATAYDTDSDSQFKQPDWITDWDVSDRGVELVQPAEAYDDGWDNNRWTEVRFGTDGVSDEGVELITRPANDWTGDGENQVAQLGSQGIGTDQGEDWQHVIIIPPIVSTLTAYDTDAENQMDRSWWLKEHLSDEGVERIVLPFNVWEDDQELLWAITIKDQQDEVAFFLQIPLGYDMDLENQLQQLGWTPDRHVMDETTELITVFFATNMDDQWVEWKQFKDDEQEWTQYLAYSPGVIMGWDQPEVDQKLWPLSFDKQDLGLIESINFVVPIFVPWTQHEDELWTGLNLGNVGSDQGQDWTDYVILPVQIDLDAEQQIPNPDWYRDWDREEVTFITLPPGVIDRDWSMLEDQLMWALWNLDQSDYWNLLRFIQLSKPLKAYKVAAVFALLATLQVVPSLRTYQLKANTELTNESVETVPALTVREVEVEGTLKFDSVHVGDC